MGYGFPFFRWEPQCQPMVMVTCIRLWATQPLQLPCLIQLTWLLWLTICPLRCYLQSINRLLIQATYHSILHNRSVHSTLQPPPPSEQNFFECGWAREDWYFFIPFSASAQKIIRHNLQETWQPVDFDSRTIQRKWWYHKLTWHAILLSFYPRLFINHIIYFFVVCFGSQLWAV